MSFLNPLAFLLLLSVPPLVLLYFLKLKRPQVRVPSTLLWQKVVEDLRVNSPFQKLKRSLLLVLQILALLAIIAALTRPLLRVRENVNESLIAILDNSASMTATEEDGRSRLDQAKAAIADLAEHLAREDEMMLMAFNSKARVICGFTADRRKLRNALARVEATDCCSKIEPALVLAKSICNSRSRPRVLLFSDGAFEGPANLEMPVEIEYQPIGSTRPNLAITGLDIRRALSERDRIQMFVAVENLSDKSFEGNMVVRLDGGVLDSKAFSVGAREILSQIFEATLPAGGGIQVEFDVEDALPCDNRAWKVVNPPAYRRVLLVGENTFFLEKALKAAPGVEYRTVTARELEQEALGSGSTVIWSGVDEPQVAPCNNIYLGCFPKVTGLVMGREINAPDVLDWDNTHPVNRFLDFDNLILSSTRAMELPGHAVTLLRSSQTPLVATFETEHGGACITGFDPMKSNWPLLVSFPLFLGNCLDTFEELQTRRVQSNISVGGTITAPGSDAAPIVEAPDGRKQKMTRDSGGGYSFADVTRCGVYTLRVPGRPDVSIAANLFDRRESLLDPVEQPVVGGKQLKVMQVNRQINREFWKPIVALLAVLLLVEWLVYHRRIFA